MGSHYTILGFIAILFGASLASAFLPSVRNNAYPVLRVSSSLGVLYDPLSTDDEFVEFPTSSQRITLKKEAAKRLARKDMPTFSLLSEESNGSFSYETLQKVWSILSENELILVRGISKDEKKWVYSTAERLCAELETIQADLPVTLLSTKGHTATIFCPTLPNDHPLHIPLRTSVGQKNTWRARTKPPRDYRGQIIKDLNSE